MMMRCGGVNRNRGGGKGREGEGSKWEREIFGGGLEAHHLCIKGMGREKSSEEKAHHLCIVDDDQQVVIHHEPLESFCLEEEKGRPVAVEGHDDNRPPRFQRRVARSSSLVPVFAYRPATRHFWIRRAKGLLREYPVTRASEADGDQAQKRENDNAANQTRPGESGCVGMRWAVL